MALSASGWPWSGSEQQFPEKTPSGASWPKISIVTATLNQAPFLESTMRSVLLQGYPNLEYIVIDGGSTDGSVDIIKKYQDQLAYWVSEPDNGHGHALNKGFARATGDILAWINSDDLHLPWTLATVADAFVSEPQVEWLIGCYSFWDVYGRQTHAWPVHTNVYNYILGNVPGRNRWLQQESVFWRRSLWERAGSKIDESYRFMVDAELWCRFFLLADLWHAEAVLGGYRVHGAARSRIYRAEVMKETYRAVESLKNKVSPQVRSGIRLIQAVTKNQKFFGKWLNVHFIANRIFKNEYKTLDFKKLKFDPDHQKWHKTRVPFRWIGE